MGYVITADDTSLAYICDTAPFDQVLHKQHFLSGVEPLSDADRRTLAAMRVDLVRALHGVDTVIYDTHFFPAEYERFPYYGHSTPEHALAICENNDVARLVLFHHAPAHSDAELDEVQAIYRRAGVARGIDVVVAVEGQSLGVGQTYRMVTAPGVGP